MPRRYYSENSAIETTAQKRLKINKYIQAAPFGVRDKFSTRAKESFTYKFTSVLVLVCTTPFIVCITAGGSEYLPIARVSVLLTSLSCCELMLHANISMCN